MRRMDWEDGAPYYLRQVPAEAYKPRESWPDSTSSNDATSNDPRDIAIRRALELFEQSRRELTSTAKLLVCSLAEAELKRVVEK